MRPYEVMFIISPKVEGDEAVDAVINRYQEVITKGGGEIVKVDKWGKRRLAYELKGFTEGFYVVINFKSESAVAQELERLLKIADEVFRYLLVRVEE
ncbi:MAG: 30S ribosomal protein S6 [Syntrophothermus sp.]